MGDATRQARRKRARPVSGEEPELPPEAQHARAPVGQGDRPDMEPEGLQREGRSVLTPPQARRCRLRRHVRAVALTYVSGEVSQASAAFCAARELSAVGGEAPSEPGRAAGSPPAITWDFPARAVRVAGVRVRPAHPICSPREAGCDALGDRSRTSLKGSCFAVPPVELRTNGRIRGPRAKMDQNADGPRISGGTGAGPQPSTHLRGRPSSAALVHGGRGGAEARRKIHGFRMLRSQQLERA